jgi:hypothetical protein
MNIKDELLKAYCKRIPYFQHIQDSCKNEKIAGALLMSPNENYAKQALPFLVVGQETNGWDIFADAVSKEECKRMMSIYEKFNVGEKRYTKPFWSVIRKIETLLGNDPCSCAWTNLSKYDQDCKRPDAEHRKIFSIVDNLLIDEIKILKPKICIFFTSHYLDYRLENVFEQIEFIRSDGFDINTFCQLKHPNLPVLTFRTYLPLYLRKNGIEGPVIDYIRKQTKTINKYD